MNRLWWRSILTAFVVISSAAAWSFSFNNGSPKWPGASTHFYTGIPGTSRSGVPWATALTQAAEEWNEKTAFEFQIINEYRDPCAGTGTGSRPDYLNGSDFRSTVCGSRLSDSTIAVTVFFTEPNILGSGDIVEADIVFNSNLAFDVYDGPLRQGEFDFRRVALHELGHVMGLSHDDRVSAAIMNSRIGNLFRLQQDDIDGINTLYSGLANCRSTITGFGWTFGALETGDCRVQELMAGGNDSSFVDVLTFELGQATRISMDVMTDGKLDSVLFLATDRLAFIKNDERSAGNCRPQIQADLPAGKYAILVNTYADAPPCGTATTGPWRLSLSYNSPQLLLLPGVQSFQGGVSNAKFYGGVTSNGGQSFGNRVGASQAFDVIGRIEIDPRHQGQPGFLAVAVLMDSGEILVKNLRGEFVAYQPEQQLVPVAERRVLGAVEQVQILRQFVASSIGISNASIDFLIGYGVDSNPDELYFHQQPINLLVE